MSGATEIYICREGQALKDGKVEYSQNISDKYAAEDDAKRRCRTNPQIQKIAYYQVNDQGDFRIFFSYTNPDLKPGAKKAEDQAKKTRKRKAPVKKTLLQKVLAAVMPGSGKGAVKPKKKRPAKKKSGTKK